MVTHMSLLATFMQTSRDTIVCIYKCGHNCHIMSEKNMFFNRAQTSHAQPPNILNFLGRLDKCCTMQVTEKNANFFVNQVSPIICRLGRGKLVQHY